MQYGCPDKGDELINRNISLELSSNCSCGETDDNHFRLGFILQEAEITKDFKLTCTGFLLAD